MAFGDSSSSPDFVRIVADVLLLDLSLSIVVAQILDQPAFTFTYPLVPVELTVFQSLFSSLLSVG